MQKVMLQAITVISNILSQVNYIHCVYGAVVLKTDLLRGVLGTFSVGWLHCIDCIPIATSGVGVQAEGARSKS